ncbi:hypothetical protein D3C81_1453370 [compost metagenome]
MVTTSTDSWVNARSGAEKRAKASDTSRPTTLSIISATMRRRWKITVSSALRHSRTRPRAVTGSGRVSASDPANSGRPHRPTTTASSAASSISTR